MKSNAETINLLALNKAIKTNPTIVTPDTLVIDAIALMANQGQNALGHSNTSNIQTAITTTISFVFSRQNESSIISNSRS